MNILKFSLLLFALSAIGCTDLSNMSANSQSRQTLAEVEPGRKLVLIMGCVDCHTPGVIGAAHGPEEDWLTGSKLGFYGSYGTLYPANLRLLINETTEDEWVVLAQRMRENSPMAWSRLPYLTTEDLREIYSYIEYLGPKGVPAPQSLPPGVKPKTEYLYFPLPH